VLDCWGKEKKRLAQIENVKCQSLPAFGGARGDQGSNAKSNPNVKVFDFWIWDFDIHLKFGFWHLALIHCEFAKIDSLDLIIPIFLLSITPLLQP